MKSTDFFSSNKKNIVINSNTYSIRFFKKKKKKNEILVQILTFDNERWTDGYFARLIERIRYHYVGKPKLEIAHVISEANISQGSTMGSLTGKC